MCRWTCRQNTLHTPHHHGILSVRRKNIFLFKVLTSFNYQKVLTKRLPRWNAIVSGNCCPTIRIKYIKVMTYAHVPNQGQWKDDWPRLPQYHRTCDRGLNMPKQKTTPLVSAVDLTMLKISDIFCRWSDGDPSSPYEHSVCSEAERLPYSLSLRFLVWQGRPSWFIMAVLEQVFTGHLGSATFLLFQFCLLNL